VQWAISRRWSTATELPFSASATVGDVRNPSCLPSAGLDEGTQQRSPFSLAGGRANPRCPASHGGSHAPRLWCTKRVVQSAGHAYRLGASVLKDEFERGGALQHSLLRYTQALITQMSQTAVCNRHHSVDQ